MNPVNGAVGLLWTGNWQLCQAAVDTVLRGGVLRPMTDNNILPKDDDEPTNVHISRLKDLMLNSRPKKNGHRLDDDVGGDTEGLNMKSSSAGGGGGGRVKRRAPSPEEQSETTTSESCFEYSYQNPVEEEEEEDGHEKKLLRLFF